MISNENARSIGNIGINSSKSENEVEGNNQIIKKNKTEDSDEKSIDDWSIESNNIPCLLSIYENEDLDQSCSILIKLASNLSGIKPEYDKNNNVDNKNIIWFDWL